MKKALIIPAALLLALTTLTTQASAGPRAKVQPVGGSSFGIFLGSPGFAFNYGYNAGYRRGWGHRGWNRPFRGPRHHFRGNYRPWGWYGPAPRARFYSPRPYYQENNYYYSNNAAPIQPVPQNYRAPVMQDAPAMHMHLRSR
ncbi:MAG: hypothetical protein KC553_00400 [Nitrospina sp.]|nr:hypothetical protein [Nitrospina sp.]